MGVGRAFSGGFGAVAAGLSGLVGLGSLLGRMGSGGGSVLARHSGERRPGIELGLLGLFGLLDGHVTEIVCLRGRSDVLRGALEGAFAALDYVHRGLEVHVFTLRLTAVNGFEVGLLVFREVYHHGGLLRRRPQIFDSGEGHENQSPCVKGYREEQADDYGIVLPLCACPLVLFHSGCVARITL